MKKFNYKDIKYLKFHANVTYYGQQAYNAPVTFKIIVIE